MDIELTMPESLAAHVLAIVATKGTAAQDKPNIVLAGNFGDGELGVYGDWSTPRQLPLMFPQAVKIMAGIQVGTQAHA